MEYLYIFTTGALIGILIGVVCILLYRFCFRVSSRPVKAKGYSKSDKDIKIMTEDIRMEKERTGRGSK